MMLTDPPDRGCDILIIAGEHSGDEHAARLAGDLRARRADLRICAVGGDCLACAGVPLLHDLTARSVVGLVEVLRNYGYFRALFRSVLEWIEHWSPAIVVLVDYPGFNLRLAGELRRRGLSRKGGGEIAVYQYISPQIWAWKAGRRFRMAEVLDELGVIFPFETECYRDTSLPVRFVGHPFIRADYELPVTMDPDAGILLLPGSRVQPVSRIFPVMLRALEFLEPEIPATVLYPRGPVRDVLEAAIRDSGIASRRVRLSSVSEGARASSVLTSSGTMSLICALAGIPGAIVYRAHPVTYFFGRRLVQVPWLGMANLILGEAMYPEFIQNNARPEKLASVLKASRTTEASHRSECLSRKLSDALAAEPGQGAAQRILELIR